MYIVDAPGLEVLLCVVFLLFWYCSIAFPNRIDFPIFCFCVMSMSAFAFLLLISKSYILQEHKFTLGTVQCDRRGGPTSGPVLYFWLLIFISGHDLCILLNIFHRRNLRFGVGVSCIGFWKSRLHFKYFT